MLTWEMGSARMPPQSPGCGVLVVAGGGGGRRVIRGIAVSGQVERAARPIAIVFHRRENDGLVGRAFRDQGGPEFRLDPRAVELDDHAGIDHQAAGRRAVLSVKPRNGWRSGR